MRSSLMHLEKAPVSSLGSSLHERIKYSGGRLSWIKFLRLYLGLDNLGNTSANPTSSTSGWPQETENMYIICSHRMNMECISVTMSIGSQDRAADTTR
eukprot:scaffold93587_cov26-Cyclotella_meneghiniana.AAC.1